MQDFHYKWGVEALRVAKPGAHLLSFGGTRVHHRMISGLEDAGWEVRDCLMWVYGQGFPKSHNIGKAIDKSNGAEREVVGIRDDFKSSNRKKINQIRCVVKSNVGFNNDEFFAKNANYWFLAIVYCKVLVKF
jgi:hypothetical protein